MTMPMLKHIRQYWGLVRRGGSLAESDAPIVERRNRMRETAVVPLFFRVLNDETHSDATFSGMMRNVSPNGANFICGQQLQIGDRLHIGVLSRNGERAAELSGRVAYCNPNETGFSVGFTFDRPLDSPTLVVLAGMDPPFASADSHEMQTSDS